MNWRNFSAIVTGLLLIAIALLFWLWYENGENQASAARDRNVLIAGKRSADSIADHWKRLADSTHAEWVRSDARHKHEMDSSAKARKPMIAKERSQRPNPEATTLVDEIYTSYEIDLAKAKEQRQADSLAHAKEVETLKQSNLVIQVAYDSTFADLLRVNDALIVTEKKLTRMEKLARFFGISAGTLAVVVAVLVIAL